MLFYNQIKREFTPTSWKRGQTYFREDRVKNAKMDRNSVSAKVQGSDNIPYDTVIHVARGTITNSRCTCPAHRVYETHCKHVAALCVWVVEKGSLLRAGITDTEEGTADTGKTVVVKDWELASGDKRLRKLLILNPGLQNAKFTIRRDKQAGSLQGHYEDGRSFSMPITEVEAIAMQEHSVTEEEARRRPDPVMAEPVLFVKAAFSGRALQAIALEGAIRYKDPNTNRIQVNTLAYLVKQPEPGVWQTTHGVQLRVPEPEVLQALRAAAAQENGGKHPTSDDPLDPLNLHDNTIPVLGSLNSAKISFTGPSAVDQLARLLGHDRKKQIVFDHGLEVPVSNDPIKLASLNIGSKTNKNRSVSYEFKNAEIKLTSDDIQRLAMYNRVGTQYIWADTKIYKLGTTLGQLAQFTNRSGVAADEDDDVYVEERERKQPGTPKVQGFGVLYDDRDHPLHPIAVYRLSLELGVETFTVDEDWKEFHEWKANFERTKIPSLPRTDYGFDLRDYQKNGLSWMWSLYHRGLAALLADDMGLGKTHQVLAFLSSLYRLKKSRPKLPSLVVAPTSVVAAWSQKLKKYDTGLNWSVFHGKGRVLPNSGVDIVLTTYGILQREAALRDLPWHVVVLDEAQAIKNATTISARAARALKCQYRLAMTGTPLENQPSDLWSLMEFLLPGYLGSLPRFKRLYGTGRETPSIERMDALKRMIMPFLLRRTKQQVLKELPEKTEELILCEMTPLQKRMYRAYLQSDEANQARADIKGGKKIDYASILALLTRLKQICDHPRLPELTVAQAEQREERAKERALQKSAKAALINAADAKKAAELGLESDASLKAKKGKKGGKLVSKAAVAQGAEPIKKGAKLTVVPTVEKIAQSAGVDTTKKVGSPFVLVPEDSGKWEPLWELMQEALGSNLKIVVFTQYLGMIDMLGQVLARNGIGYTELKGDTIDRQARLEKFANEPECKVFLCSLLAGGLGIDLTAASVCIHLDRWWNPAKENQATDRVHRMGQTRGVQVFKLQIPGTVEDRIAGIIQSKLSLSGALIEESPLGLKAFSRKELLELLTLKDEDPAEVPGIASEDADWDVKVDPDWI